MTVELKACPFCGGKAQIMYTKNIDATRWFVTCLVCGVETPRIARNAAEAYRAWNRRTTDDKPSEWISVEDRLPEKNTYVLCYFKYEPESPDVICNNLYYGGKRWLSEGSKVTHWMPLPAPPKMKGG